MAAHSRGNARLSRLYQIVLKQVHWLNAVNQQRRAHKRSTAPKHQELYRRSGSTETLEPRFLLASDFTFDASADSNGINAILYKDNTHIRLKDADTNQVRHSQAIGDSNQVVTITGSGHADTLQIDATMANYTISFTGGEGLDKLLGPDTVNTWQMDGPDSGKLNSQVSFLSVEEIKGGSNSDTLFGIDENNEWEITGKNAGTLGDQLEFSEIENLSGGAYIDLFIWGADGELTGTVDGRQGRDILDYTSYTDPVTVTYDSDGSLQTTATKIGGSVKGIHEFVGGENAQDTLVGQRYDSTNTVWLDTLWTVEGEDEGRIDFLSTQDSILFSGFENLTGGKSNRDTFWIRDDGKTTGTIDGGGFESDGSPLDDADSLLISNGDNNVALVSSRQETRDTVTLSGKAINFKDIEPIIGGTANNRLIMGSAVNDWFAIEQASDDPSKLHLNSWRNDFLIAGTDKIETSITFVKPEKIKISPGEGSDRFAVLGKSALTVGSDPSTAIVIEFDGGAGKNTFIANNESHEWEITGRNKGTVKGAANNTLTYENVQYLVGGELDDTFKFSDGGSVDGWVDGWLGGENTLDYSSVTSSGDFDLSINKSNVNITNIIGTDNVKVKLIGLSHTNTWTIDGSNEGKVSSKEIVERTLDKHAVVDHEADLITFDDYIHEFDTGDKVSYATSEDDDVSGLKDGSDYYVVVPDASSLKLSETYVDAVRINEATWSTATRFLQVKNGANWENKVNLNQVVETGPVIKFQNDHGFKVGEDDGKLVRYDAENGKVDDSGLEDEYEYYVIVLDSKRIQLLHTTAKLLDSQWTGVNVSRKLVDPSDESTSFGTFDFSYLALGEDKLQFPSAHNLTEGQSVKYRVSSNDQRDLYDTSGLVDGVEYKVERLSDKVIRLRNPKPEVQSLSPSTDWSTGTNKLRYEQTLANIEFSGIHSLKGGNNADTFKIRGDGQIAGSIDGGDTLPEANHLDLSEAKNQPYKIDLTGTPQTGRVAISRVQKVTGSENAQDILYGNASGNTWSITGANAGTVGEVQFSDIENLSGSATASDGFVFEKTGSISGSIEAGDGGGDTLAFKDDTNRYFVIPTAQTEQILEADKVYTGSPKTTLVGIEQPLSVTVSNGKSTVSGTPLKETWEIKGSSGGYLLENKNPADKYWDQKLGKVITYTKSVPEGEVKIDLDGGADTISLSTLDTKGHNLSIVSAAVQQVDRNQLTGGNITFTGDIKTGGGDLTIEVGGTITVKAGVTISTIDDTSPSGEDSSGNLKLLGKQLIIEDNAKLKTVGRLDATKTDPQKIPASLGDAAFPQLRFRSDNSVVDFWESNTVYGGLETLNVKAKKLNGDAVVDPALNKITFPSSVSIDDIQTGESFQYITPLHDTTFDESDVDSDSNKITLSIAHEFYVGDRVTYDNGGGESFGGLTHGKEYFVIPDLTDEKALQLSATREGAFDSEAIALDTSQGSGSTHSLQPEFDGSGLTADETYFVLKLNHNTIQLSANAPHELALESDKTKWGTGTRSLTNAAQSDSPAIDLNINALSIRGNAIVLQSPHGLADGTTVKYAFNGATGVEDNSGLKHDTEYYAAVVNTHELKLLSLAHEPTIQTISDWKNGARTLTETADSASVLTLSTGVSSVSGNEIEFLGSHGLKDGVTVKYKFVPDVKVNSDGSGLANGDEYLVTVISPNKLKLTSVAPQIAPLEATRPWSNETAYLLQSHDEDGDKSGSGLTLDIVTDADGNPSILLNERGEGYEAGDVVAVNLKTMTEDDT
ncbi:MAG: hypothetical protein GY904_32105, partial [Planctomycetaceae bacterium]|nr:hypothetical protein [Planctomycetaceae bacterium]